MFTSIHPNNKDCQNILLTLYYSNFLSYNSESMSFDLEKAWKSVDKIYNDPTGNDHIMAGIYTKIKKEEKTTVPYYKIKERDEFFNGVVPQTKKMVNEFLRFIGLSLNHTMFQGGNDPDGNYYQPREEYLFPTTNRLIPGKDHDKNFDSKDHLADSGNSGFEALGDHNGWQYYNSKYSSISVQEREAFYNPFILIHEYYHQICFGEQTFRTLGSVKVEGENKDKEKLASVLIEGTVEMLAQITVGYFNIKNRRGYPNEVAFIFHMLKNIAEMLGDKNNPKWKTAILFMTEWGLSGGANKNFVILCKNIKTDSFPNGFDVYSADTSQMQRLNQFLGGNNYRDADISEIIESLSKDPR